MELLNRAPIHTLPATVRRTCAADMAGLAGLFALRVAGQALQRWMPQAWLPPFAAWQGSSLPYAALLAAQLAILAAMARTTWLAWQGRYAPSPTTARWLASVGGAYLALSLARLIVGVAVPGAPAWFSAWISGVFHVVLASFVLLASASGVTAPPRPARSWLSRHRPFVWYPLVMGLAIAMFFALLAHGAPPMLAAYLPVIAAGLAIVRLEAHFPLREDWRARPTDLTTDAAFLALVMVLLPRLLTGAAVIALAGHALPRAGSAWWPHDAPLPVQIVLMVLCVDFARYWLHRVCHRHPLLWRLHEVHHAPEQLYLLNVGRFHPLEKAMHFALDSLPFLWLGVSPSVFAGYLLLYSVNGFFQHCNVDVRHGWLNRVVSSAEMHRWHHAVDPRVAACNFANTTVVWDLVFGTWHLPRPAGDVGVQGSVYPRSFVALLWAPMRRADGRRRRTPSAWLADGVIAASLRWTGLCARWRLARTLSDPMRVQAALLARIVAANRDTAFGREHGFDRIDGPASYAANVPVRDHDGLRAFIDAEIATGEPALTAEPPIRYARTSGTTGAPKDVPLTASHLASLQRDHRASVAFQYRACPEAFAGGILAMVSPAFEGVLGNGKPYGSASGIVARSTPWLLRDKFVVPAEVLRIADSRVKYLLALRLAIARDDVSYLAAANPTTLLAMMALYREHAAELAADVRTGGFFLASAVPADVWRSIRGRLRPDPSRADALERSARTGIVRLRDLWPAARLVVAWTGASAGIAARTLREELAPRTTLMELGYLSSEFRGTVTLGRQRGSGLPTLDTHYFEFVEPDRLDAGTPEYLTIDRLRKGGVYHVVVTTPSGLYRYFINDLVRVTGFLRSTPLLAFAQKGKGVTNLTGEKLYEAQALNAVHAALAASGIAARFVMMLADDERFGYTLHVEAGLSAPSGARHFTAAVDERLCALNLEYAAKRESGRLRELQTRWLAPGTGDAYKRHCVARGQREGQFKMVAIDYRSRFAFDLDACSLPS